MRRIPCSGRVEQGTRLQVTASLAPVLAQGRDGRRVRRYLYGGARKSGARVVGWAESDSAKGFAEAPAHVKGYSCCCFVAAASHIGAVHFGLVIVDLLFDFDIGASRVWPVKRPQREASRATATTECITRANKA